MVLRLALGVALLRYGFIKVFPIQFPPPPLAVLNEPVGNSSPTMLFWALYGLHPGFQMALAWIEVVTGLLLLFRRSAFLGVVLALLVMTNVALLDLAFDVPVKLYSLSLVAMALALLIPESRQLWKLVSSRQVLVAEVYWSPELPQRMGSMLLLGCELLVALLACWQFATGTRSVWQMKLAAMQSPALITGGWVIKEHAPGLVGGDGSPLTSIYFDPDSDTYLRATDGSLWGSRTIYDHAQHRLRVLYEVVGMWMSMWNAYAPLQGEQRGEVEPLPGGVELAEDVGGHVQADSLNVDHAVEIAFGQEMIVGAEGDQALHHGRERGHLCGE